MSNQPATVTPQQAAAIAGMNRDRIYEALHSGRLPHLKSGVRFKIPRDLLDEWIRDEAIANTRRGRR